MSKATNAQEFITEFANAFSGSGDSVKLDEFFADDVVFSDYSKCYNYKTLLMHNALLLYQPSHIKRQES